MVDDTQKPGRPRREPPTIDLKATETSAPPKAGAPISEPSPQADVSPERGPSELPPSGEVGEEMTPAALLRHYWPAASAVAVAVILGVVIWAAALTEEPVSSDSGERLARIETQLRELAARRPPEPKGLDDIAARLGRLEAKLAQPQAPDATANLNRRADEIAAALRETRERTEAVATGLADLAQQVERARAATIGRADLDALARRVAALEASTKSLAADLGKALVVGGDRAARYAVLANALKTAVDRGIPFRGELAAIKPLVADQKLLAALEPHADSGVPGALALARELAERIPEMRRAANVPSTATGVVGRLQANVERLVRIRPVDEAQGDDVGAIIARMEAKGGQGDLSGALAEAAKLPPEARAPIASLMRKAEARATAIAAVERIVADALNAVAKADQAQK